MTSGTKVFLFALKKEVTVPMMAFFLLVVLLAFNLNAIVDSVFHPGIPYFDEEHLIVGGAYALLVSILLIGLCIYHGKRKQAETALREREEKYRKLNEELEMRVEERTRQLIEAQDELIRKGKLAFLGQLSGSVGHELRNPLGVISNAVYFLQTTLSGADETVKEYLDIIKSEVNNSMRIISDLLDFSRTRTPRTSSIPVHELIRQCLDKCSIPEGITVNNDIPEALPLVSIDPFQMGQVFQNLIMNAVQAMAEGGTLHIDARKGVGDNAPVGCTVGAGLVPAHGLEGQPQGLPLQKDNNFIEISVTDTGEGISPENISRLFQPLFTTKARGIGLGLTLSKRIIEANNGSIEVQSRTGKGTTFTVILPAEK